MELNLNVPQQVFTVFYAIAWGTTANALPRWKAFAWGRVFVDPPSLWRALVSFALLNLLPVAVYIGVLCSLDGPVWILREWGRWTVFRLIVCVVAAFAVFGCFRIWASVMQRWSSCFYGDTGTCQLRQHYPGLMPDDLDRRWASANFLFGLVYLMMGVAPSIVRVAALCLK